MTTASPDDFDYVLPEELIAQAPLPERDGSRLMLLGRDGPEHRRFRELPELIASRVGEGALLVLNDTRVIPARLMGRKIHDEGGAERAGGRVELLLCDPIEKGREGAGYREIWRCLYRASKPLRAGAQIRLSGEGAPRARVLANQGGGRVLVELVGDDEGGLLQAIERVGRVPLPPYIRRGAEPAAEQQDDDRQRYQTVYARDPGAVAAPTAGLHFTCDLLARLGERGIGHVTVTLHIGPGTFAPILETDLSRHVMHAERYNVPKETARALLTARQAGRKVVAVGTTVVRTLESALSADGTSFAAGWRETELFIRPPYRFRAVDALITNFHLPRSTLLMLVCALGGRERVLAAYREAVARGYRFYSYGDAMLIPAQMGDPT